MPTPSRDQALGAQPPEPGRWFVNEVYAHDAALKSYLRRRYPAVSDIEDVVQESYLRVWRRHLAQPIASVAHSVRCSIKSFLFQVARNLAIDTLRHQRASPIIAVTGSAGSSVIDNRHRYEEAVCAHEEMEILLEAVDSLPSRCREIMILHKFQGIGSAEIARRLAISEETVRVQARRGLLRCQNFLRRRGVVRGQSK